jgi:hypothetical protein
MWRRHAVPASGADGGFRDGFPGSDAIGSGHGYRGGVIVMRPAAAPSEAQPWLARAFFLRFASLRFRFTDGFS